MAQYSQNLCFFNFEDLGADECELVQGILEPSKVGKSPELPWTTLNTHDEPVAELPPLISSQDQGSQPHYALPLQDSLASQGAAAPPPPMYTAPLPAPQIAMHPTHMIPTFAPTPGLLYTPHAPVPYVTMVGTNSHALPVLSHHMPAVIPVSTMLSSSVVPGNQLSNPPKVDAKAEENEAGVKVRRNKKKRPPDYYAKLEAREAEQTVGAMTDTLPDELHDATSHISKQQRIHPSIQNHPITNGVDNNPVSSTNEVIMSNCYDNTCADNTAFTEDKSISSQIYSDASRTEQNETHALKVNINQHTDTTEMNSSPEEAKINVQPSFSPKADPVISTKEEDSDKNKDLDKDTTFQSGDTISSEQLSNENSVTDSSTTSPTQTTAQQPNSKPKVASWAGLFKGSSAPVVYDSQLTVNSTVPTELSDKNSSKKDIIVDVTKTVQAAHADSAGLDTSGRDLCQILKWMKLSHKSVSLQPRGLSNRSNWCYVNATLQALLACPPFYHLFKSLPSYPALSKTRSSTPIIDSIVEFVNEFTPMQFKPEKAALNGKGTVRLDLPKGAVFEPSYVYKMLQAIKYEAAFKQGRQEDAEEFLSCLLNGLHEEMVAAMKDNTAGVTTGDSVANGNVIEEERGGAEEKEEEEDSGWEQVGPRNRSVVTRSTKFDDSPISAILRGQIRSVLHKAGSKESATLEPFFTLQLDVQAKGVNTVEQALEGLAIKEVLHDYTCSQTKQEVDASRRYFLEELPPVLVLHLKWFTYDKNGGIQKNVKQVDFGVDLEINKDLLSPTSKCRSASHRKYKLFAVVSHLGGRAVGGHYITDVFHPGINGWVRCDDSNVSSVPITRVIKFVAPKVPYLLYYRRLDLS